MLVVVVVVVGVGAVVVVEVLLAGQLAASRRVGGWVGRVCVRGGWSSCDQERARGSVTLCGRCARAAHVGGKMAPQAD